MSKRLDVVCTTEEEASSDLCFLADPARSFADLFLEEFGGGGGSIRAAIPEGATGEATTEVATRDLTENRGAWDFMPKFSAMADQTPNCYDVRRSGTEEQSHPRGRLSL